MNDQASDHDVRHDLSEELWTVSDLLVNEGKADHAGACRDISIMTRDGAISVDRATKALGFYENLL